ncbi:NYN domain-containing protein [Tropicibacter naphthalenivorans]|uniref:NYN domain protein n=1 Tax=Tropicibacter naphthalenivorans TaxID=441103 RepID=A0A0P1GCC2_9RHOB|nr:NYN domain-containing protein [Tropicibacter naphthalenivorans]CUH79052.1 NYN domain protein [Tropicibacter naphthalenivorans]SMD03724.1 OST-HTH/LOTUS domain-containing protein [Tropicibacter naphthalenivorans]
MRQDTRLLAVLIDADNTSPKYAKAIFDEIAAMGEASVRRCYGDFSSQQMAGWNRVQADFGIVPHHSPANTVGKNASDIALVIDAMDLMHSARFDGFVLVSSDSDFTRLASRIREQGLDVFGMGMEKTPSAFRKACKRFIFLENLDGGVDKAAPGKPAKTHDLTEARDLIFKAMAQIEQEDEWYGLGEIGQVISAANPDFDTRSYGKRKLSDLVSEMKVFELRRAENNQAVVRRID